MLDPCFIEIKVDLPGTKNHAIGQAISKDIAAGEYTLRVDCYPRGWDESRSEYVSLVMWLLQASTPRPSFPDAIFEAFVLDADGQPSSTLAKKSTGAHVSSTLHRNYSHNFPRGYLRRRVTHATAWSRFAKRSDLEPLQAADGVVRLVFGIVAMRDDGVDRAVDVSASPIGDRLGRILDSDNSAHVRRMVDRTNRGAIAVPASDIGDRLGRMLDRTVGADVSFSVGGETFRAHRVVLAARSPVFEALLCGSMAEARMPCITVHDTEPSTFKALLRFAYTDTLPEDAELAGPAMDVFQHLLVAADRYAIDRLKLVCANRLREIVTVDTLADVLESAIMYNCPELKDSCIDFILEDENFTRALSTQGFRHLVQKFPLINADLFKRATREI